METEIIVFRTGGTAKYYLFPYHCQIVGSSVFESVLQPIHRSRTDEMESFFCVKCNGIYNQQEPLSLNVRYIDLIDLRLPSVRLVLEIDQTERWRVKKLEI